jgi:hypothetical protein
MGKRGRQGSSHSRNGADADTRGGRNNGTLDFAEQPMGVGESRLAFRCRVRDGCYRGYTEGSYCIFKLFKPEGRYARVESVGAEDVAMQLTVKRLAEQFNDVCQPTKQQQPCEIVVRDAALGEFDDGERLRDASGRVFRAEARRFCSSARSGGDSKSSTRTPAGPRGAIRSSTRSATGRGSRAGSVSSCATARDTAETDRCHTWVTHTTTC